jgi:Fur family transcriptional regulator, ferric uptake regulator
LPELRRKRTRQGAAVLGSLDSSDGFRTAQQIHADLRADGDGIGLTTVYRHLQLLADDGEVDVLQLDGGEVAYRRCASDRHHHHLVCRRCGHTVEIEGPAVETWAQRVAEAHGFVELSHTAEVFGLCKDCGSAR